jgi:hypothetical protein
VQETASDFKVAPKEKIENGSDGHHFCIAHLVLPIFGMVKGFQKGVSQIKNCYNLAVQVASWFSLKEES